MYQSSIKIIYLFVFILLSVALTYIKLPTGTHTLSKNPYDVFVTKEINDLAISITEGLSNDAEKSKAIHDWVASNISYDVHTYFSGNLKDHSYSALETLNRGTSICAGYANLNAALHKAVGIPVKVVSGVARGYGLQDKEWHEIDLNQSNHAWNEVYIDGRWVVQDPTWNAGYVTMDGEFVFSLNHKYYDPDPLVFSEDHRKLREFEY
ncbi:transglutaminase domain-containing protein [Heliorestis acidaminivorans]|uniref:Transglutaminase domain-containing protein n=1 Tax=Heliorestis acidaminivorans TaxID=553427 RepID=A0A6I0ETX3_9FIRM|nr:transglutaminase-like domain-containing protein [Heliorestis acidaminivorans]KAB2950840.1 transglutaminase domain-containing protein [Heliorestis acidaminivorans]